MRRAIIIAFLIIGLPWNLTIGLLYLTAGILRAIGWKMAQAQSTVDRWVAGEHCRDWNEEEDIEEAHETA